MNNVTVSLARIIRGIFSFIISARDKTPSSQYSESSTQTGHMLVENTIEKEKLKELEQKVSHGLNSSQVRAKMKELYNERVIHDYIMLNPEISLNDLFSRFEDKPLNISRILKILKKKNKIDFISQSDDNLVRTVHNDFNNNLIIKKISEKHSGQYKKIISCLQNPKAKYSFKNNHLLIKKGDSTLIDLYLDNWKKL